MAITWGPAVYQGGNGFRVGYEFSQSPATLTSSTGTVTVTCTLYGQTQYYSYDSGVQWSITNQIAWSGTTSYNVTSGTSWSSANVFRLGSGSRTLTPSTTTTTTTSITGNLSGLARFSGLSAHVSGTWTTGKKPLAAPAAPTGCGASRVSDTQSTVTWTNTNPSSSTAPYQYIDVQRSTNDGAWTTIASPATTTSYSDKTLSANHKYSYRVRARNGAGSSAFTTASAPFATTPAAPGTPTATKGATNITVTWGSDPPYATGLELWHSANGVWDGAALATLTGTATTYTHASPSTLVTHAYRLRATTTTPALTGGYSGTSNTVALTAPPNAPSNLSPASVADDASTPTIFTWKHNPVDTTLQTKYQVQHRVVGAGSWTIGSITSSGTSSYTLAGGVYANGQNIEWQVRTWGQASTGGSDGTGASPFSTSAVLTLSTTPVASVVSPAPPRTVTDGATTASSPTVTSATANFTNADVGSSVTGGSIPAGATILTVNSATSVTMSANSTSTASAVTLTITDIYNLAAMTVQWAYSDAEATAQAQAVATLYGSGLSLIEQQTVVGPASQFTFTTPVANGSTYTVGVKVQDGSGLWSTEAQQAFSVIYSQPPQPTMLLTWDSSNESVAIAITNPPTGLGQVDAVATEVWRSIGGDVWILISSITGLSSSVIDYIPDLVQTNSYKVVAVSALPSRIESAIVPITPPAVVGMVVNAGPSFAVATRLPYNPEAANSAGRAKVLQQFAGRTDPVEFVGDHRSTVIDIQAVLSDQLVDVATIDDITFIADLPAPACYRDPSGARTFVSMGTPAFTDTLKIIKKVSWQLTKIDYTEQPPTGTYVIGFGLFFDDDGVPYFDPTRRSLLAIDADGVPYIVTGV